jgi:ferrous iron transport protein B
MSCSARLPVYFVMVALLLPFGNALQTAGVIMGMYFLGTAAAFIMAWVFKKTLLRGETPMLLLELPPYRAPALRGIFLRMWDRSWIFLRRAGTIILALNVILWVLLNYPAHPDQNASVGEQRAHSYAGRIGHAIEPVIKPLGYDWKIGIGLVGSFAARELFVSTMSQVYSIAETDEEGNAIEDDQMMNQVEMAMAADNWPDGRPIFTPLVCLGLMVFYVLAMQCLSTVAVVKRETGGWKWPLFQLGYMTALAWLGAFIVYQGGRLLGFQ